MLTEKQIQGLAKAAATRAAKKTANVGAPKVRRPRLTEQEKQIRAVEKETAKLEKQIVREQKAYQKALEKSNKALAKAQKKKSLMDFSKTDDKLISNYADNLEPIQPDINRNASKIQALVRGAKFRSKELPIIIEDKLKKDKLMEIANRQIAKANDLTIDTSTNQKKRKSKKLTPEQKQELEKIENELKTLEEQSKKVIAKQNIKKVKDTANNVVSQVDREKQIEDATNAFFTLEAAFQRRRQQRKYNAKVEQQVIYKSYKTFKSFIKRKEAQRNYINIRHQSFHEKLGMIYKNVGDLLQKIQGEYKRYM